MLENFILALGVVLLTLGAGIGFHYSDLPTYHKRPSRIKKYKKRTEDKKPAYRRRKRGLGINPDYL